MVLKTYEQLERQHLNSNLRIELLADHQEILPLLTKWFEREWWAHYGPTGPGDAQSDLLSYANRHGLPVGVVALHGNELRGITVLKAASIVTHSHLSPWVAAGLVKLSCRRQGIGTKMLRAIEEVARHLGFARIYCGTSKTTHLLNNCGWQFIEQTTHNGKSLSILQKVL